VQVRSWKCRFTRRSVSRARSRVDRGEVAAPIVAMRRDLDARNLFFRIDAEDM